MPQIASSCIVIVRLVGLGDLLMLTPAIREHKKRFPLEKIALVVGESNKEVFDNNPHIDMVIGVDDVKIYSGRFISQLQEACKLINALRKLRPSKIFLLQRDWRWSVVAILSGIKKRLGFRRHVHSLLLTRAIATTDKEHEINKYFRLFSLDGSKRKDHYRLDIFSGLTDKKWADDLVQKIPHNNLIALSPGGAVNTKGEWALKRWPLEYYQGLLMLLAKKEYTIVLIGGTRDVPLTKKMRTILPSINSDQLYDLAGKYPIQKAFSILKKCMLMVTHDSGAMHIAAAADIPVISIFGPTRPDETRPLTEGSYSFWHGSELPCAPCYRFGKLPDCKTGACMKAVTPEMVYDKITELSG
ncbi:glycosyltransferase family 9 protein [Thermodesulfobacteriota bacterium]